MRVVGREFGRDALHQIVSITGAKGNPQPEKWKIVLEDPQSGGVREVQVADGNIASDHGGGIASIGAESRVTLEHDFVVSNNIAVSGSGGGLYISPDLYSALEKVE